MVKHSFEHLTKTNGSNDNMCSVSGFIAQENFFAYWYTKAAISQMTRNMALDLAKYKIRVNCICPGQIYTPGLESYFKLQWKSFDEYKEDMKRISILGRIERTEEVAKSIMFLVSDDSSYITGANLFVDRGQSCI